MVVTHVTEAKFPASKSPTDLSSTPRSPVRTLSPRIPSDQFEVASDQDRPNSSNRFSNPSSPSPVNGQQLRSQSRTTEVFSQSSKVVFRSGSEVNHDHVHHPPAAPRFESRLVTCQYLVPSSWRAPQLTLFPPTATIVLPRQGTLLARPATGREYSNLDS